MTARSVTQWRTIVREKASIAPSVAMLAAAVADFALRDAVHYQDGRAHAARDRENLENALLAFAGISIAEDVAAIDRLLNSGEALVMGGERGTVRLHGFASRREALKVLSDARIAIGELKTRIGHTEPG